MRFDTLTRAYADHLQLITDIGLYLLRKLIPYPAIWPRPSRSLPPDYGGRTDRLVYGRVMAGGMSLARRQTTE
jgi:hypothetical protein